MELFNDVTLAGVAVNLINEKRAEFDTSLFGSTEPVVILGTAFTGPVGKAVEVYSPEFAKYVFGKSYDPKSKKAATLLPSIVEAWNAGARTIYAVRVSGKEVKKEFNLRVDTNLKLRVAGKYPSNQNKEISMEANISQDLFIKIFKPAERATISEKNQGLVDSLDSILTNKISLLDMGLTVESELIDLVQRVNSFPHNNVLLLSIVDENGNDVTLSSAEAKALKIKDMFSGLYTIGRERTLGIANTIVKAHVQDGDLVKTLKVNSDVTAEYPIFAETKNELGQYLGNSYSSLKDIYGFATIPGAIDELFEKDKVDYEEVNLSDFDLYKKLGSGFAVNCKIERDAKGRYKVKEVEDSNENKKTIINDGIYSMLENLTATNRVLAGVGADSKIKNKLPDRKEFDRASNTEKAALEENSIVVETVVNNKDLTAAKAYKLVIEKANSTINLEEVRANITADVAKVVSVLKPEEVDTKVSYKEGSLFLGLVDGAMKLHSVKNGVLTLFHSEDVNNTALDNTLVVCENKLYICVANAYIPAPLERLAGGVGKYLTTVLENGTFQIAKIVGTEVIPPTPEGEGVTKSKKSRAVSEIVLETIGTVEQVFSEEEDVVLTTIEDCYGAVNEVKISSTSMDIFTLEDFVEILNANKDFKKVFALKILKVENSQSYVEDLIVGDKAEVIFENNKSVGKDEFLYIPYRTDDNFARHLAQHCIYTSLKTAPARGFLGVKPLLDVSLDSVSNKVKQLTELRLADTLIGKKANGTNLLNQDNMPYLIGRKVSVCFGQYIVRTDDNYSYVSNMAAGYAGMVSNLPLDQAPTCQPIKVPTPMFELTNYQLTKLTDAGYVTIKNSFTKGWVITDGITMAPVDSEYRRVSASRISDQVEAVIRSVCEPYIGKTNNQANQNSLTTGLKSDLEKLKGKIIEDFRFRLIPDAVNNSMGILDIDYEIMPVYEIKTIRNNVKVGRL